MGQWAQEAVLRFRNAKRDLEYDRTNAALDEATQAYAAFQVAADAEGMAECVRIVCHAMARQGLRKQAIQMATEELEKFREQSKKRAEALMLLTLAEIKLNASAKETREEAAQLANQAKSAFQTMKDRRMEGESCLANGNALLKLEGTAGPAAEAFEHARSTFRSLQSLQLEGRALHGLACCRAKGGRFDQAVQRGNEALDCFVECRNECLEAAELEAISSWQLELGDSQSALKSAEQSLALAEACSPRRQALALRALVRAYIAQGKAGLVLGNCVEAVSKFQEANAREAESIGLLALVECSIAAEDTLDRTMQAATDACLAFRELGDAQQEMQMLCTMSRQCLRRRQLDQAEDHARTALHIAQAVDDRALRAESVGLLADVFLAKPNSDKALAILKQEQAINRNDRDALGQALCLLSMANVHMELSKPKEVLACAEEARALFRSMGDKMGELSALQITADVHARAMRYSDMLATLEKALQLATGVGDTVTEASLNVSIAQATMGLMEVGHDAPDSPAFKELASKAAQVAKKAVGLARRQQRTDLVCSALCALSQSQFLGGEKEAARQAASTAANLARNAGDRLAEATALVLSANTYLALGKGEAAKQASSKALYVFEEVRDYVGQDLAKATLDAVTNPVSAVSTRGKVRVVRKRKAGVNVEVFRQKVRDVVSEIVGMDNLMDDTPLMQSGLTSQSAVILRNELAKAIPGPSLPFTLMFDHPSISDLSGYFAGSTGEEDEEEWIEVEEEEGVQALQQARRAGPKPEEVKKQVRDVVVEIVGMEDLVDDTPLMQAGLTSQSAVLLRNSLSKQLPGASLPFTMMFDYPSVSALTDFFVARSGPLEEEESQSLVVATGGQAGAKLSSSMDPHLAHRQVRKIVEDIVGMEDFPDDAALMQHGVTSHNAVLLRDALSKEFKGPNMPHTLIFDYPSVSDLTDYILDRAQR